MPCGGHDVGMNVWVENGDVMIYVARSGMFDENNTLLKAGRLRLRLTPNPFNGADAGFSQTLKLDDGAVYIKGKDTEIRLWADVYTSAVFAEISSKTKTDATLSYESWRYKDRPVTKAECQQCSYKWNLPKDCTTYQDSIRAKGNTLVFWHKNREQTVFDFTVNKENLDSIKAICTTLSAACDSAVNSLPRASPSAALPMAPMPQQTSVHGTLRLKA